MLGDRVAVMRRGYVEQVDAPDVVYHQPQNRFVAEFLGAADFLPVQVTAGGLASEIGLLPSANQPLSGRPVHVMVRPHDLRLAPGEPGHGVISAAQFVGDFWHYSVRLPSGGSVRCQMPHTAAFALGTPVQVWSDAGHGLVCFDGDRRVN